MLLAREVTIHTCAFRNFQFIARCMLADLYLEFLRTVTRMRNRQILMTGILKQRNTFQAPVMRMAELNPRHVQSLVASELFNVSRRKPLIML